MICIIDGPSHLGKTALAKLLCTKLSAPYLSLDLLKMGLIRAEIIPCTPLEDEAITACLEPIITGMVKTALENEEPLIVEGGYINESFHQNFTQNELKKLRFFTLLMSREYLNSHYADAILRFENVCEKRPAGSSPSLEELIADNAQYAARMLRAQREPIPNLHHKFFMIKRDYSEMQNYAQEILQSLSAA